MNDLIQRIANAVIRQEGQPPDAFNAGDLRGAPWLPAHSPGWQRRPRLKLR